MHSLHELTFQIRSRDKMRQFTALFLALAVGYVSGQFTVPNFKNGRTVIVHLFEWPWAAIADECERYGSNLDVANEHNIKYPSRGVILESFRKYDGWTRGQSPDKKIDLRMHDPRIFLSSTVS